MSQGLVTLLALADSRLPAGGHAHSGGVEPALAAGLVRDVDDLAIFLRGRVRSAGLVAAAIAAATTFRAAAGAEPGFWAEIDAETDARIASPAQRAASRQQGRALFRVGRAAWPAPVLDALATSGGPSSGARTPDASRTPDRNRTFGVSGHTPGEGSPVFPESPVRVAAPECADPNGRPLSGAREDASPIGHPQAGRPTGAREGADLSARPPVGPHHPVVLGAVGAAAGCTPVGVAHVAAYLAISGPAAAAIRLRGFDPFAVQALLAALTPEVEAIAAEAGAAADGPLRDLPCVSAPRLDLLAEVHIRSEVRLFAS